MHGKRSMIRGDQVGPDVTERLRPVRIRIELEYQAAEPTWKSGKDARVSREYLFNLNSEALHPERGPEIIARHLATSLFRRLRWEGWPYPQQRSAVDLRPGEEGYHGG